MNFQEAETLLFNVNPNPYINKNNLYQAFIVPKLEKDFVKFLSDIKEGKALLSEVKDYSTNDLFSLYGGMKSFYNI